MRPLFLNADSAAARDGMDSMTVRQKIGQLMMLPLYSKPGESDSFEGVAADVLEYDIGGVIAMQGDRTTTKRNLRTLDSLARSRQGVGLMTAMDAEWGAGMRLGDGLTFPKAMSLGATENEDLVRQAGYHAGLELKALGIGIDFAPVADVNSNPANPVIGNRSFGSRPDWVGRLAAAWAEGLRKAGVMAVGKHFPGHGDADLDSHLALPRILSDSAHFDDLELPPFRTLIHRGVEGIMTAHLDVPALDSITGMPTSLSPRVVRDLLIDSLGFEGLVFTDALTMAGASDLVPPGTREVAALKAGNDILLFPSDPALVIDSIESALRRGELDTARLDDACFKVLMAKQWLDVPASAEAPTSTSFGLQQQLRSHMLVHLGDPETLDVRLPPALVIIGNRGDALERRMKLTHPKTAVIRIGKGPISEAQIEATARSVEGHSEVVLAFLDESNKPSRRFGIPQGADRLIERMSAESEHLSIALFTSPYALAHLPNDPDFRWLIAHQEDDLTQTAAMAALCGEGHALGRLPVDVAGWKAGMGNPISAPRLFRAPPDSASRAMGHRLDSLADAAIAMGATPGMRILVTRGDSIRHDAAYGSLGDEADTPVERHHLYDLASITKVAVSTLLTMISVERGLVGLDQPLGEILPRHPTAELHPELARRTLRDVLAHRSGLPAWIPFYMDLTAHADSTDGVLAAEEVPGWVTLCSGRCMHPDWCDSIRTTIRGIEPKPSGRYRYSDIGYYLLQEILEARWDMPLAAVADSLILRPLGLQRMGYLPLEWSPLEDIAPTERDTSFRDAWVRGYVHDPGAAMMGGVAGHAGLFSDAHDLAVLMECLGNGGVWRGTRIVRSETVAEFTRRAFPEEDNRRALGWDKPGLEPETGASGNAGSWSSFGHSGFTGTLAWTDPEGDWTAIILANRVCPDAGNRLYVDEDIRTKALVIIQESLNLPFRFADAPPGGGGGE